MSEKINLEQEKFLLAHRFRGSANGQLTPLLWTQDEAEHHGGREWKLGKATQFLAARKQRQFECKKPGKI